ncbi:MAG TPA: ABC-2 transporter permease [Candidatus Thermoplasmatota archaeon]|nr:ABC-2 transporter permease [Candidatus Thermoplasmatota archaeon]
MKAVAVAVKTFKEFPRDRRALAFLLLFPVIFVVVFGSATFDSGSSTAPHTIAVISEDEGAWILNNTTPEFHNFGEEFTGVMENATYEDSTTRVFRVFRFDRTEADRLIANRGLSAIVTIPANFSAGVRAQINQTIYTTLSTALVRAIAADNFTGGDFGNYTLPALEPNATASVVIEGDFTYSEFASSQAYVQGFVDGFVEEVTRIATDEVLKRLPPELQAEVDTTDHIDARTHGVAGTEEFEVFDWMAPGLFVFATILVALAVTTWVAREVEGGNLERLKLSKMGTADFLVGLLIPWASLGAAQVALLFGTAILMGFSWQGGAAALVLAIAIGTLSATASVALGLLLVSFVKSERQATSIGPLIIIPIAFLTEAFFPIAFTPLVQGSPWGQAVRAERGMLTFGLPFEQVAQSVLFMALQTAVLFAVAIVVFRRARLVAE